MASIIKFSGYAVDPNDDCDAEDFMFMLNDLAASNDMYTGPLETEARRFEWDDDLLINDTDCPDEVFEMYFDGTIKSYDDIMNDEINDETDDPTENSDDEEISTIYITVYDDPEDGDEDDGGDCEDCDKSEECIASNMSDEDNADHLLTHYVDNINKCTKEDKETSFLSTLFNDENEFFDGLVLSNNEIALLKNKINDVKTNGTEKDVVSLVSALEMLLADE